MSAATLIATARAQQYRFGQFFDPMPPNKAEIQRDQPALGKVREPFQVGTYALVMLRLAELTGNQTYRDEAEAAIQALFGGEMRYTVERDVDSNGPINQGDSFRNYTLHDAADFPTTEIFGNSYGVIAAAQLAESAASATSRQLHSVHMRYFVNSLMRDTPWVRDRTDETARSFDGAGLFAPYVGQSALLPWESNVAQAGITTALGTVELLPAETRTLLLKISNLHRLNGFSWYPAGYTPSLRTKYKLPVARGAGGYLEYIPIESMYSIENNVGSAGQAR
eukprot:SAG11_NODE_42_length_20827_cov_9.289801_5_plen_280_part_00